MRDTLHASRAQPPAREMLFGIGPQPGSADHTAARLRAATRYYEQHVIAWHALGHLSEARAARDHIAHYRQKLDGEPDQPANTPIEHAAPTSHHDAPRAITDTPPDGPQGSRPTVGALTHRDFTAVTT